MLIGERIARFPNCDKIQKVIIKVDFFKGCTFEIYTSPK